MLYLRLLLLILNVFLHDQAPVPSPSGLMHTLVQKFNERVENEAIARQLAERVLAQSQPYQKTARDWLYNLGQNPDLLDRLRTGALTPLAFSQMTIEQMAPPDLSALRQAQRQEAIQQVVVRSPRKGQTALPPNVVSRALDRADRS